MRGLSIFVAVVVATAAISAAAYAAPLPGNGAYVTINNAPLYQDNPDKSLKFLEGLTLGDVVTVTNNRPQSFKESGASRDFIKVKAPDNKEGWVRVQFVAARSTLAVVKNNNAIIFSEPRYVKATARFVSPMTVVAVLQDGTNKLFGHVQGYDVANKALLADNAYVSLDDLSTVDADVQGAVLYAVAMDAKGDVKKSLLKLASTKYGTGMWGSAIDMALNGGAPAVTPGTSSGSSSSGSSAGGQVASRSLLDSGDLHVTFEAGTVTPNATTHNIVRLARGDSTANDYVDGTVTDIKAQELDLGQARAVFIQTVTTDKDGTHGALDVFSEDSDGFSRLGGPWDVPAGATVQVLSGQGGWAPFKVTLPDSTSSAGAYTSSSLYVAYDTDQNQYAPDDFTKGFLPTDQGLFQLNDDRINMRDSPSTSGKVVATLSQDTKFRIVDRTDQEQTIGDTTERWYKVVPQGSDKAGWIFGGFIQAMEMDEPH